MQLRIVVLGLLLAGGALAAEPDSVSGWIPDPAHPQVQYRFKCFRGSLVIDWRNGYPGDVTLTARIRGSGYDGNQPVTIPAGGSTSTDLDTLYCTASLFEAFEKKFSMATPPPPAVAKAGEPAKTPPPPAPPTVAPWIPPAKLAELPAQTFALVHAGMKRDEVLRVIGSPASKLTIPEDDALIETYRYPVSTGRAGTVRLSNGVVTEADVR